MGSYSYYFHIAQCTFKSVFWGSKAAGTEIEHHVVSLNKSLTFNLLIKCK